MSIQGLFGKPTADGRFAISWEVIANIRATSIQVALDSEFTNNVRTFVLPAFVKNCNLDVGNGNWFYRIGGWIGTWTEGIIDWSGIYGPIKIVSPKPVCAIVPFPTEITYVKPALNSIIFYTDRCDPYYMIVNISEKENFKASQVKTHYYSDLDMGHITISDLSPEKTYSFQFQMLAKQRDTLPTDSIQLLTEEYTVLNKRTGMYVKPKSATEHTTYAADKAMINDSMKRTRLQFFSYAQYLQFQAAKARTSMRQD